jgi:hypothetical protein
VSQGRCELPLRHEDFDLEDEVRFSSCFTSDFSIMGRRAVQKIHRNTTRVVENNFCAHFCSWPILPFSGYYCLEGGIIALQGAIISR